MHRNDRGPVAALQDLMGGQGDMMFASVAAAAPHVQSGRLQALAVTAPQSLAALPAVPERFAKLGTYLQVSSPAQFQQLIQAELPKWRDVVQRASIQMD